MLCCAVELLYVVTFIVRHVTAYGKKYKYMCCFVDKCVVCVVCSVCVVCVVCVLFENCI